MHISILTLFPDMFTGPFDFSIVKRAQQKNLVKINLVDIRDFANDAYKTVDDHPYGGGVGMIMRVDVLDRAIEGTKSQFNLKNHVVLLDPKGTQYDQQKAREFMEVEHLILICGHYEGVDARVYELVDEVCSIGNFVVTGGELPAMLITDSIVRLLPGVLKHPEATVNESFSDNLLEAPQFTRPAQYHGMSVPQTLLSGNHKHIEEWKKEHQTVVNKKTKIKG